MPHLLFSNRGVLNVDEFSLKLGAKGKIRLIVCRKEERPLFKDSLSNRTAITYTISGDGHARQVEDVLFVVDPEHPEAGHPHLVPAHVAGHLLLGPHPALVPARPDAAGPPVALGDPVLVSGHPREAPSLHHALESASDAEII